MTGFKPASADYAERVRDSFARQSIMSLIGAEITRVEPGLVEVFAVKDAREKRCAKLLQTLMTLHGRSDLPK